MADAVLLMIQKHPDLAASVFLEAEVNLDFSGVASSAQSRAEAVKTAQMM